MYFPMPVYQRNYRAASFLCKVKHWLCGGGWLGLVCFAIAISLIVTQAIMVFVEHYSGYRQSLVRISEEQRHDGNASYELGGGKDGLKIAFAIFDTASQQDAIIKL